MFWFLVAALWTAMLLSPFFLLYLFLPSGKDCPRCTAATLPIRSTLLRPLAKLLTVRWCLHCGWEGVARIGPMRTAVPSFEAVPDAADDTDEDAPWRS